MIRAKSLAALAILLLSTTVSAQMNAGYEPAGMSTLSAAEISAQAAQLASRIRSELGDRTTTSSAEDLEGFIVFIVDQGGYADPVWEAALDILAQNATGNYAKAIENARQSLRKKRRGTGAIPLRSGGGGTGAGTGGGGDFPAPGVGTGGGGVNYGN